MTTLRILVVSGKSETVAVHRRNDGLWVASGTCGGTPVRVEAPTEDAALERWLAAAEGQGSGQDDESTARKADAKDRKGTRSAKSTKNRKGRSGRRKS